MNKKIEAGEPNVALVTIRSFDSEMEAELAKTNIGVSWN